MAEKQRSRVWQGWILFGALGMIIVGVINIFEGIVTLVYRDRTIVIADRLYVVNVVGWGILVLVSGAILTCAGLGVLAAWAWARVVAIVCVGLHMIVQIASLAAYPVWSVLMLALDVVVMYALVAAWQNAELIRRELTDGPVVDPRGQQAMWEQHPRMLA